MTVLARCAAAAVFALPLGHAAAQAGIMSGEDLIGICEPARADPVYRLKLASAYVVDPAPYGPCYWQTQRFWDGFAWRLRRIRVCG